MKQRDLTSGTVYHYLSRADHAAPWSVTFAKDNLRMPGAPAATDRERCPSDNDVVVVWAPPDPTKGDPPCGVSAADVKANTIGDMKAALRGGVKPDITHVRTPLLNYVARACEYGNDKYERSNYLRPTKGGTAADFERLRAYLRAMVSHGIQVLDAMEAHQAGDPKLEDVEGMKKAAFAIDTDPDKTGKVGPSKLPHICGSAASLMMAITQAVQAGLLPADPGTPWRS